MGQDHTKSHGLEGDACNVSEIKFGSSSGATRGGWRLSCGERDRDITDQAGIDVVKSVCGGRARYISPDSTKLLPAAELWLGGLIDRHSHLETCISNRATTASFLTGTASN